MSKILVIYTGGTIGSVYSDKGIIPIDGDQFRSFLDGLNLSHGKNPYDFDFVETSRIIDSTNATIPDWNEQAQFVADRYHDYDGFVVLGGTDTMDYMAAALSEILINTAKPVITTGSMQPFGDKDTDAVNNVQLALLAAINPEFQGVFLAFDKKILSARHILKLSTEKHSAFVTDVIGPIAVQEQDKIKIKEQLSKPTDEFSFSPLVENYLPFVSFSAGNNNPFYQVDFNQEPRAIIVQGHGNGSIPQNEYTEKFFKTCHDKDIPVFIRTRVPHGDANAAYEAGTWFLTGNEVLMRQVTEASSVTSLQRFLTDGLRGEELRQAMRERVANYIP